MDCEICGRREAVCFAYLEGAKMNCCAQCARGGKVLYNLDSESGATRPLERPRSRTEEDIVEGYGGLIRSARTSAGLSIEQLGMKIAEKANYLNHIERGEMLPSLAVARKLEKFFKIRLVEAETVQHGGGPGYAKKELTLLDIAEIEKKEKKKK